MVVATTEAALVVGVVGCADHVGVARGSRTMFSELCRETLKRSVIEGIQAFQDLLQSKTREFRKYRQHPNTHSLTHSPSSLPSPPSPPSL